MPSETHFYEPAKGHRLRHDPFNSIIGPRPIGWISTRSAAGLRNLAPYSFFNAFNYQPPIIGFASTGYKDSVRNIEETGEFAWNLATLPLAEAMNQSSATVGPEVDEFEVTGLTPVPSRIIQAPRVGESPVAFECRLSQLVRLQGANGLPVDTWMVLGEVVGVHIDPSLIDHGVYRTATAEPILRGGGPGDYFKITAEQLFVMPRPR